MASPIVWGAGFAGSGIDTATVSPVYTSAATIWLNSATGNDSNAGTEPELPVKTLAQAYTNASAGSVICIASGHSETLSSTQTFSKAGLRLVGFGTGSNRPQFTASGSNTALFVVSANNVVFESLYFKAATVSNNAGSVVANNSGLQILSCQFDCGVNDVEKVWFNSGTDNAKMDSCTFTAVSSRPTRALNHGSPCANFVMTNTTFDGSSFGWAGIACVPAGATNLVIKNLTLAGQADLVASVTSYQIFGVTTSGAGRVTIS